MKTRLRGHELIRDETVDRRVEGKAIRRRATRLGNLELLRRTRRNRTDNAPDDVVDEAVRHRRRDDEEEEGGCERGCCLAADHLCIFLYEEKVFWVWTIA